MRYLIILAILLTSCQTIEKVRYVDNNDLCHQPKMLEYKTIYRNNEYLEMIAKKINELPPEVATYFSDQLAVSRLNNDTHENNINLLISYINCLKGNQNE